MKKILIYSSAILCMMATVFSCQKAPEVVNPAQEQRLQTFTLSFPEMDGAATKVSNNLGTVGWEEGDQLVFQGCPKNGDASVAPVVHTLTASEITDPKTAVITVDLSSLVKDESTPYEINVAYPAGVWSSYSSSHTYGRSRFTDATNRLLMAGYINGSAIELMHVTAVLFFKVPAALNGLVDTYTIMGNNGEVLGYDKYLVELNSYSPTYLAKLGTATYGTLDPVTSLSGPVTADGTTVHAVYFQNEVNFTGGFTIQFNLGGDIKKTISTPTPLHLVHGHGVDLGLLPDSKIYDYVAPTTHDSSIDMSGATALDGSGTANCYIVDGSDDDNASKVFTFKAYKGNSTDGVGTVASAEILWETYNNAETVAAKSVIAAVDFDKQEENDFYTMVFKMPATLNAGNALIAAKDAGDNILWSWHIWIPAEAVTSADYTSFIGSSMMNMNLGALRAVPATGEATIESLGLLYQWGRKDPFVGARGWSSYPSKAKVAGTEWTISKTQTSIADAIKTPTVYYFNGSDDGDWNSTPDGTLWGDSKTKYDPCPPGYKVPVNTGSLWTQTDTDWNFDTTNHVSVFAGVRLPMAGFIEAYAGSLYGTGGGKDATYIWSATKHDDNRAKCVLIRTDKSPKYYKAYRGKANAGSVRCVAE